VRPPGADSSFPEKPVMRQKSLKQGNLFFMPSEKGDESANSIRGMQMSNRAASRIFLAERVKARTVRAAATEMDAHQGEEAPTISVFRGGGGGCQRFG